MCEEPGLGHGARATDVDEGWQCSRSLAQPSRQAILGGRQYRSR